MFSYSLKVVMSLLQPKRVPLRPKLIVHGFARGVKLFKPIPEVILRVIILFFYIIDLDYWQYEDNNEGNIIRISHNNTEVYLLEMKIKHKINVKGENIIKSNNYDGKNRRIYIWTLSPFQIGFHNMWQIGLEGKRDGFYGITRNGFTTCLSPPDSPEFRIVNYFNWEDRRRSFNLDHKLFNFDDKIQIKMYFEPSPTNNTFDIEFHKNNRLILEYRSIPIGDDYKLCVKFLRFSSYLNSFTLDDDDDDTNWLQEIHNDKIKYAGFEINNFQQKIQNVSREWWI